MQPDAMPVDRNESVPSMEPLLLGARHLEPLSDMALTLAQKSASFRASLPPGLIPSIAGLIRSMNCYYSNLIEGHNTHPVDIERALNNRYSSNPAARNLQLEAKAHIAVQQWIDAGGLPGNEATTVTGLREIHRRFCELLPADLLCAIDPATNESVSFSPGHFRIHDVIVGRHIAISPGAVPRFMDRFQFVYSKLGIVQSILASAAAHHRLVWIHPFLDGNGRVARLMSHAFLLQALNTGSLWSVSRGLARNVQEYKTHLANCDLPRRNDLDGRGALSEEALALWTGFFLKTCIDQVTFMEALLQPDRLRSRILGWATEEVLAGALPVKAPAVLEALLYRGELSRAEAAAVLGTGERQSRRIVAALMEKGVVFSETPRSPLRLMFPAVLAGRWLPGLFPDLPLESVP